MDGQVGAHGGQGAARRVGRAVRASGEDVDVGLASLHRSFTLQATGVAMANATNMFMRENSWCEMMRVVGANAVASVEIAVPPTMVAGELGVDTRY